MILSLHARSLIAAKLPVLATFVGVVEVAQIPVPPASLVGYVAWGLVSILAIVVLFLSAVVKFKQAFGRTPPINETLAGLATLKHIDACNTSIQDLQEEMHLRSRGIEEQVSGLRHETRTELQSIVSVSEDRRDDVNEKLATIGGELAKLNERTERHTRSFDAVFTKCDNLLARLGDLHRSNRSGA